MLAACYPSNSRKTPMVVMEQDANVIKRIALFSMEAALNHLPPLSVRSDDTFRSYCPQKQIAVLRSAAGVPSFLNQYDVSSVFLQMNSCVRNVWSQWLTAYVAANVDAPNRANVNVPFLYDNWIYQIVANVSPFLRTQVQHLITLYNSGSTTAATVDLSWPVLLDNVQFSRSGKAPQTVSTPASVYESAVPVTQAQLTAEIYNAIQDINWLNFLPRH